MSSNKNLANAMGGKTARACDNCIRKRARWFCAADDAFLCQSCDSSIHSANSLARRHERLRLNSASSNPTSWWRQGFTTKPRTTRRRPKPDESSSLVPESEETTSREENEPEDQLLYRVPVFDLKENEVPKVDDLENLHGFLPSDMELAEFAADVESLLGKNLESECFDMERLMDCREREEEFGDCRVKVEEEEEEGGGVEMFEGEIDMIREPFELNFEDFEDAPMADMVGVKKEREDEEWKRKNKRKLVLSLDCDGVIKAWGGERSPWITGERPELDPDDCWPHCLATICGAKYGQWCGDLGVVGRHTGAMASGGSGREARVLRYREKRRTRLFSKKIRYEVRKLNAEKRPRMKGRFVKRTPFAPPSLPLLIK